MSDGYMLHVTQLCLDQWLPIATAYNFSEPFSCFHAIVAKLYAHALLYTSHQQAKLRKSH